MDTLGADILRLWVASTDYSGELSISDEILKRVVEATGASATPCASCWPTWMTSIRRRMAAGDRMAGDRPLRAADGRSACSSRSLKDYDDTSSTCDAEAAGFLFRGPGRVLSRHPQGPALHRGQGFEGAAFGAERAVPHHPQPAAADGAGSVVHRGRGLADFHAQSRATACCCTPGMQFPECRRRPVRALGRDPRVRARKCRRNSRRCGPPAKSARRCRRKSKSCGRRPLRTAEVRWATTCVSCSSPHRQRSYQGGRPRSWCMPSDTRKCERCWHYRADVGHDPAASGDLRPLHGQPLRCGRAPSPCVASRCWLGLSALIVVLDQITKAGHPARYRDWPDGRRVAAGIESGPGLQPRRGVQFPGVGRRVGSVISSWRSRWRRRF